MAPRLGRAVSSGIFSLGALLTISLAAAGATTSTVGVEAIAAEKTSTVSAEADLGVRAFEDGDYTRAIEALEAARTGAPEDADLQLLLGISYYRVGRSRDAEPLLEAAAKSADPETAGSARVFLGLIAKDRGEVEHARGLLGAVARSGESQLAAGATSLLDTLSPRTLAIALLMRSEYDSNVALASLSATPASSFGQTADVALYAAGSVVLRPSAELGLSFSDTASFHKLFQLSAYDQLANTASARWDYLAPSDRAGVAAAFDAATLGGSWFYLGATLDAWYRRALWGDFGAGARYGVRPRHYSAADYDGYSGWTHSGALELSLGTPEENLELNLGALFLREQTSDATLTATGFGGRLYARGSLGSFFGVGAASFLARGFETDPSTGTARHDDQLIAEATAGYSLSEVLALVTGISWVRNFSNNSDFDYEKLTIHFGLELAP